VTLSAVSVIMPVLKIVFSKSNFRAAAEIGQIRPYGTAVAAVYPLRLKAAA
jgi:hypothetical protein